MPVAIAMDMLELAMTSRSWAVNVVSCMKSVQDV